MVYAKFLGIEILMLVVLIVTHSGITFFFKLPDIQGFLNLIRFHLTTQCGSQNAYFSFRHGLWCWTRSRSLCINSPGE